MGENEKKPKKGYVWAYVTTQYNPVQAVIYDFQDSRSGQHAEEFLNGWQGHLVCDDYSGYKARFKSGKVIEVGCMAHARRKFHELYILLLLILWRSLNPLSTGRSFQTS
jgi:hypothetical protein